MSAVMVNNIIHNLKRTTENNHRIRSYINSHGQLEMCLGELSLAGQIFEVGLAVMVAISVVMLFLLLVKLAIFW